MLGLVQGPVRGRDKPLLRTRLWKCGAPKLAVTRMRSPSGPKNFPADELSAHALGELAAALEAPPPPPPPEEDDEDGDDDDDGGGDDDLTAAATLMTTTTTTAAAAAAAVAGTTMTTTGTMTTKLPPCPALAT